MRGGEETAKLQVQSMTLPCEILGPELLLQEVQQWESGPVFVAASTLGSSDDYTEGPQPAPFNSLVAVP